jgi:23S rRNA (cytidine1920-2'-O)/16S rRNA (cytidine1409-2'-O)-methyltransferase
VTPRADVFLVERGYALSRAEAQAAIRAGNVSAEGKPVLKPSQIIAADAVIAYRKPHPYVSRGALKLAAVLDRFELSPAGLACIDVGASTGGFTEILLERGAKKVYAVDVGHGQLHPKLAADPRVVSLEHTNIRDLDPSHLPGRLQAIVADVSFISLKLALPRVLAAAIDGAWLVALVKPQFEVGKEKVGKKGVVRDSFDRMLSVITITHWLYHECLWNIVGVIESPILGSDGNREYLVAARKGGKRRNLFEWA